MAWETVNPDLGYASHFIKSVPRRMRCPICLNAMRDPMQTDCGHLFCAKCIEPILDKNPKCPVDRTSFDRESLRRDMAVRAEILNLAVYCDFRAKGCKWGGPLKHLKKHCGKCKYSESVCVKCRNVVPFADKSEHLSRTCPMLEIFCVLCDVKILKSSLEKHIYEDCEKYKRPCPFECDNNLKMDNEEIKEHLDKYFGTCPRQPLKCPLFHKGCAFEGDREAVNEHVLTDLSAHENMMIQELSTMHTLSSSTACRADSLFREMTAAHNQTLTISASLAQLCSKAESVNDNMDVYHQNLSETACYLNAIQSMKVDGEEDQCLIIVNHVNARSSRKTQISNDPVSSSTCIVQKCEKEIQDLKSGIEHLCRSIKYVYSLTFDGRMLWNIPYDQTDEGITGENPVASDYDFFSTYNGYRLKGYIAWNCEGDGKDTFLGIYVAVQKGTWDMGLKWPFQHKVEISLLNKDPKRHMTKMHIPDPMSPSTQMPTELENQKMGIDSFIRKSELANGFIQHCGLMISITLV